MQTLTRRNHFLPQFYLAEWATPDPNGKDRKLWCHHFRPEDNAFHSKRYAPKAIGFGHDTLTVPASSLRLRSTPSDSIEREFSTTIDDPAAEALRRMQNGTERPHDKRSWLVAIESMMTRHPDLGPSNEDATKRLREILFTMNDVTTPDAFSAALHLAGDLVNETLPEARLDSAKSLNTLGHLLRECWVVRKTKVPLLLCDVPVATKSIQASWLAMPLDPDHLLQIGTPPQELRSLGSMIPWFNRQACLRAKKQSGLYVYSRGKDDLLTALV